MKTQQDFFLFLPTFCLDHKGYNYKHHPLVSPGQHGSSSYDIVCAWHHYIVQFWIGPREYKTQLLYQLALYIDITIKEKKKLRTVKDYISILSPICFLFIVFEKVFTTLSIDHILGLEIVNTTWTMQHILGDFCIEKRIELRIR